MSSIHQKGKKYERHIAYFLSKYIFDIELCRVQNSGGLDIKGDIRPRMREDGVMPQFDWVIECKNQKSMKLKSWIRQMEEEEKANNKNGLLAFHVHGSARDVFLLRTEIANKYLYPPVVSEYVFEFNGGNYFKGNTTQYAQVLQLTYDLFKVHVVMRVGDYTLMNKETFGLLWMDKKGEKDG